MPYLPAKDELVSLDRLSSRGLWKWYNSKGFGRATIWRGAAFHFLAVFSKMKILWKLWLWFSKMFHQRVLSDWKWSISKFQFWRRILDIYRQPLSSYQTVASRCLPEQSFHGVIKTFILLSGKNKLELLPFSLYSEMFNRRAAALKPSLFSKGVFVIFLHPRPLPSPPVNIARIWILKFLFVSFENEGWRINFFICTFKPERSKFCWLFWRRIQKSLILRGWDVDEEWNVPNWWFQHNKIPIILKLIIVPRIEFCTDSRKKNNAQRLFPC